MATSNTQTSLQKQGDGGSFFENAFEYILFTTVFVVAGFLVANLIDIVMNHVFHWIETTFSLNSTSSWWLFAQVVLQVLVAGIVSFYIREWITKLLMRFSSDEAIYGSQMYSILFAFITFYGQDHLKRRMSQLNQTWDNLLTSSNDQ